MTAPARPSTAATSAYPAFDADDDHARWDVLPGERVGRLPARTGGKSLLWGGIVILIALGGWALLRDQATWPGWLPAELAAVFPSIDHKMSGQVEPAASAVAPAVPPANVGPTTKPATLEVPPPPPPQPPTSSEGRATREAVPPLATAALPPATTSVDEPAVEAADPYRMRAEAVGLHPDLSRVLLARLSPTDYRNASIAIRTAVAETPDNAVFVWPRQRKPELALFHVRFVPGAAPGCRRYVVAVTKDGWLTTALPMEKCGVQRKRPRE